MLPGLIVLSVPMYFVLMGVEAALDRRLRLGLYRANDALCDMACGVFQQLLAVLARVVLVGPYIWVYEHWRLTELGGVHATALWLGAFVATDFFYYWFHRWSHECAIGWFSHVVHHQSEDYNLAVALRQDAWQPLFSQWFYLPLALVGVPPAVFASVYGVVIVYQFWIHTRMIGKLGALEWVFNTPSHHRVHHGVDPKYLDKNYAGVFIVWDMMFGTFQREEEAPTYGTIEALRSFNPAWAHVQYGLKMVAKMRGARSAWDAVQVPFRGPGWQLPGTVAEDLEARAAERVMEPKYEVRVPRGLRGYVVGAFVLAMAGSLPAMALPGMLGTGLLWAMSAMSVWAFANVGGLTEQRGWARGSERARLLVGVVMVLAGAWRMGDARVLMLAVVLMAQWVWLERVGRAR